MSDLIEWDKIAFDVARNQVGAKLPADDLIMSLGLTEHEFELLCEDDLFRRKVKGFAKELTENGTSFALKAQVQAEELLKTQFRIARDPDTPPSVAVAAIANTVRWAGFDKKAESGEDTGSNRPKISINITMTQPVTPAILSSDTPVTLDVTPTHDVDPD